MGFTDPGIEDVRFIGVGRRPQTILQEAYKGIMLKAGCFETAYHSEEAVRKAADALESHDFGLIVANDIAALPVALSHRKRAKILFDAHEYAPREFEHRFLWRFFMQDYKKYLCRTRIHQVDAMTTVGPAIADEYAREFGMRPSVVLNAPYFRETPCERHNGDVIRMVHHGGANRERRLEAMIDAMALLGGRFHLDAILVPGDAAYIASLKKRASFNSHVSFLSPVQPTEIVETLSGYDVGFYALPPSNFNARYALPNKFFDFIQARLCIAIGPSPEMKKIVEKYDCGVVAKGFTADALAEMLRTLDRQKVEAYRRATNAAATDYCYERSAEVMENIVRGLLGLGGEKRERGTPAVPTV